MLISFIKFMCYMNQLAFTCSRSITETPELCVESWLILDTIACDMRMQCPFWIFAGIFPLEKVWVLMLFRKILSLSCSKFVRIKPFLFVPDACLTFLEYTLEIYLLLSFYAVFIVNVQYTLHIAVVFQLFTLANIHRLGKDYPVDAM